MVAKEELLIAAELLVEVLRQGDAGVVAGEGFVLVDRNGCGEAEAAGGRERGNGQVGLLWRLHGMLAYFIYGTESLEGGAWDDFGGVRLPTLHGGLDGDALGKEESAWLKLREKVKHDGELGFVLESALHGLGEDEVEGLGGGHDKGGGVGELAGEEPWFEVEGPIETLHGLERVRVDVEQMPTDFLCGEPNDEWRE